MDQIQLGDYVRVIIRVKDQAFSTEISGVVVRIGFSWSSPDHYRFDVAGIDSSFDTADPCIEVKVNA